MTLTTEPLGIDLEPGPVLDRSFELDDLIGVAGFLAGNVIAHRAEPEQCARELLSWADDHAEALDRAARAIAHDRDRTAAHDLLRRAHRLAIDA